MKLQKSNYENKTVIYFLKDSIKKVEATKEDFNTSQFIEADFNVRWLNHEYIITTTLKGLNNNNLVIENRNIKKEYFKTRTETIVSILKTLKITK